jgi:CHAT domain-containing protein/Tfp pilus assembly protein PilF
LDALLALPLALILSLASPALAAEPSTPGFYFEQGLEAFQRGAFELAAESWSQAARAWEREGDSRHQVSALVHLAAAHSVLGQYRQALSILDRALKMAEASGERGRIPSILARLGNALIAVGPPDSAEAALRRSLEMAREAGDTPAVAAVLNDLGNHLVTQKKLPEAVATYRESATLADRTAQPSLAARARINEAVALMRSGAPREARPALDRALEGLEQAAPSHDVAFALVNLGVAYRDLSAAGMDDRVNLTLRAAKSLNAAAIIARDLGDRRTASYAWGYLGGLYEDERRYEEALELTRQAIFAAQQAGAPESLYRWLWQAGRLHRKMGNIDDALDVYRLAVQTLGSIRPELSVRYEAAQASFRESVGPLYLELVDLLLRRAGEAGVAERAGMAPEGLASGARPAPDAADGGVAAASATPLLAEAREVIESLKVAELRDYFRDDCVDIALSKTTRLDVVSPTAAVIYPIVLPDRTELLVTLPSGLRRFVVATSEAALTREIRQFRRMLERRNTRQYLPHARQLYDWLIRPLEQELSAEKIDTLVFVPDGPLRTIPMAALHDGRQFLVAKYALAITPGLKLTDPRPISRKEMRILAVGITEAVQGFPPLPEVEAELNGLRELFRSTTLINEDFSIANFEKQLRTQPYTIVHIASHAEFSSDVDKTFLLAFDTKVTIDRLDRLIGLFKFRDEPLELLTLSACDTAEGDDRAALGLAGVAVKAGARSAVATLWSVNDEASAELIADFYRQLKDPTVSRATALRRAQVKMLSDPRYQHPGFWSPFLLINNWL